MKSSRILTKPFRDNLIYAARKVDQINDNRVTQQVSDCIQFLLIELARIDQGEGHRG